MNILGIETSCDETAAAVVKDGREVLSNVVYTQIPLHQPYGGVVPEIASRAHIEKIHQVIGDAIRDSGLRLRPSYGLGSDFGPREISPIQTNPPIQQSTNPPILQSFDPPIRQSFDPPIRQSANPSIRQSTNPPIQQSTNPPILRSTNPPIDAVAVTYGPGLSPALIVGLNAAKGLAKALNVPLIAINHIEAHLHSPFLYDAGEARDEGRETRGKRQEAGVQSNNPTIQQSNTSTLPPPPSDCTPALGLAISGGNTMWVDMPEYGEYRVIGETLDDAAGEAFDKAAKLLGLGYPGGLKIDRISAAWRESGKAGGESRSTADACSQSGNPAIQQSNHSLIPFPKGRPREGVSALAGLPAELCVSFSGLKTALLRYVQQHPEAQSDGPDARDYGGYLISPARARIVASYQEAIVQAVADRTRTALRRKRYKSFILGGGVSLNSRIREVLTKVCAEAGVPFYCAKPKYTGDNGAMIAGLAYYRRNLVGDAALAVDASPSLEMGLAAV